MNLFANNSLDFYGCFIELEPGIEGLVHVSEISWTKHIKNPSEEYSLGDQVEAKVLSIDVDDRKISLGVKQLTPDPWDEIEDSRPPPTKEELKLYSDITKRVMDKLLELETKTKMM